MDENKQIIKERFESLPKALQDYITSDVWSGKVSQVCAQVGVPMDTYTSIENEVFFVLIGLEPARDLKENIIKETGLTEEQARKINDSVNGSVLSPVMSYITELWREENSTPEIEKINTGSAPQKESKVGDSFTQAIVNQAKAMQPIGFVPENLPTESTNPTPPPQSYAPGKDPYHEAIE